MKVKSLSHVQLFGTPWTVTCQAPLSVGFSKEEYTGVDCHFLLQPIVLPQGWKLHLLNVSAGGTRTSSLGAGVSWFLLWVVTGSGSSVVVFEGCLKWFSHLLGGVCAEIMHRTVLFLPAFQKLQFWFWSFCFLFLICPSCVCGHSLSIPHSFFVSVAPGDVYPGASIASKESQVPVCLIVRDVWLCR